jgi:hypothetical protein
MPARDASEQAGIDIEPAPLPPIGSPLMMRALEIATSQLGVEEQPPGSNRGPEVDRYVAGVDGRGSYLVPAGDARGVPWCARFAVWCIQSAAVELGLLDPLRGAGDLASAHKWSRWARSAGRLRQEPRPGYVGLLLHSDQTGHVVLVADVQGSMVVTREGNSRNAVRALLRDAATFAAWVEV